MYSKFVAKFKLIRDRATPQVRRPFYIGLAVGLCLAVLVALGLLNTEQFLALPSEFEGVATSQAIWGLKPSNLMMVLPLGAFLVVLARSFIGLKAFGLFTPMLVALAFLQIGPIMGPIVLGTSVGVGMIVAPSLLKLRMTRVGFLGVLISLIVLVLVALQMILDTQLQVDAFPVVVCALVVERWWRQWEKDGPFEAAHQAFNTFMISIVIQFVMVSHLALMLIEASPLLMPGGTAIAIAILGRYRGLRLTEIGRFAPIWLERRRNSQADELPADVPLDRRKPENEPPADEKPVVAAQSVAKERAPPLEGAWVIASHDDLIRFNRRRVPQPRKPMEPDSEAQFVPRIGASGRPPVHNAWLIRKEEDV
ncbi:7TM domain-containing protein [Erythrobacter sp. MTPC3]|uniref:7TM domain-containing protein n=1 Tax=Erythrobacter sp. MTPC3 TaxID=3056564 RepID=UPI0036F4302A